MALGQSSASVRLCVCGRGDLFDVSEFPCSLVIGVKLAKFSCWGRFLGMDKSGLGQQSS